MDSCILYSSMDFAGKRLAHYEITSLLGKGGMGEVYRAKDTKLGREVAIKTLPDEFTKDPERLARFEREARLLASLSHPNIAGIFEVGSADSGGLSSRAPTSDPLYQSDSSASTPNDGSASSSLHYLVMQLAEGEDLAQRLRRGPISVDDSVAIAIQIADALDAAHEKGIVHRDLKPANVMVDQDGNVMVLDFGLAKAMETDQSEQDNANSPTMIRAATHAGIILGTAGYMSPEQARGKRVDKRADIWAFGVLLWEMLIGERLFEGDTISDTLAAVLTKEPDFSKLPPRTPSSIRWILERCLERDPRKRLRDIGEARLTMQRSINGSDAAASAPAVVSPRVSRREALAWALCALLLFALIGVGWMAGRPAATTEQPRFIEQLSLLETEELMPDGGSSVVISGDGRMIVLVATDKEGPQLYLNKTDQLGTVLIPGTRGASGPFFSPNGEWIGFFADGKLKKVATSGGAPLTLCDAGVPRGGSWGDGGRIVFTPGVATGLSLVSENGGPPETLSTPDEPSGERSHRWPQFLPGGEAVVYMAQGRGRNYEDATLQVVTLNDKKKKTVYEGGAYPRYVKSGHLLFARQGTLFAIPFDLPSLSTAGTPRPILQELLSSTANEATSDGTAHMDVSRDGILVYRKGTAVSNMNRMVVVDRQNRPLWTSPSGNYTAPAISPDGMKVAVGVNSGTRSDIWIWDADHSTMNRLTFDGNTNDIPVWSPHGTRIAYSSTRPDQSGIGVSFFVKSADGSGSEHPLVPGGEKLVLGTRWLTSWASNGEVVIYQSDAQTHGPYDVYAIPIGRADATVSGDPMFRGRSADLSPDGRWIAYQNQQAGDQDQIYVRSTGGSGEQYQVSSDGGAFPHWTKGGREIIYNKPLEGFWAVAVEERAGSLVIGSPTRICDNEFISQNPISAWDVSDNGSFFVGIRPSETATGDLKNVILSTNFFDELRRLAPAGK